MPRAVAAPIEFFGREEIQWESVLLPRLFALRVSTIALHEYVGAVRYRLHY